MCLAVPGKVVKIENDGAVVDYEGEKRKARLLNKEVKEGDYVVVQSNLIIQKVPEKEAIEAINTWNDVLENEG